MCIPLSSTATVEEKVEEQTYRDNIFDRRDPRRDQLFRGVHERAPPKFGVLLGAAALEKMDRRRFVLVRNEIAAHDMRLVLTPLVRDRRRGCISSIAPTPSR